MLTVSIRLPVGYHIIPHGKELPRWKLVDSPRRSFGRSRSPLRFLWGGAQRRLTQRRRGLVVMDVASRPQRQRASAAGSRSVRVAAKVSIRPGRGSAPRSRAARAVVRASCWFELHRWWVQNLLLRSWRDRRRGLRRSRRFWLDAPIRPSI